jgi:hypothetical protein
MLTFDKKYFLTFAFVFIIEVLIALFIKGGFIRHYLGDFLAVILVYAFIRSFIKISYFSAAIIALLFAFAVEFLQYINAIGVIGLADSRTANIIMGSSFDWLDMLTYTLAFFAIVLTEWWRRS